eukprot:2968816-Alexandrium_andersonii.AAC.1
MGWWSFRNHLEPQLLRNSRAKIRQRRLTVGLEQNRVAVPQPVDAGHSLIHRVLAQPAFPQDW